MRLCPTCVAALTLSIASIGYGQTTAPAVVESGTPLLYVCEKPGAGYRDVVTLDTNEKLIGKALEWATDVLLFDGAGNARRLDAAHLRSLDMRRDPVLATKPNLADLTTAYIERKSEKAIAIHVLNAGSAAAKAFDYRVSTPGGPPVTGRVAAALPPGGEQVIDAAIGLGVGPIRVELDTKHENAEIAQWNNTFVEPGETVGLNVVVSKDRYDAFKASRSMLDTFCFEDWIQFHIRTLNELFSRSVYPTAPRGILKRVSINRIVVQFDISDAPGQREKLRKEDASRPAIVLPRLAKGPTGSQAAELVDWALLRDIGLELGLFDLSRLNAPVGQCLVRDGMEDFVQREFRVSGPPTMMDVPGPRAFSELDAAVLNRTGSPASGSYFSPLPELCALMILDYAGRPLPAAEVAVYQRSDAGREGWEIGAQPIFIGASDATGRFELKGRQGGPFGEIARDGSNGVTLIRVGRSGADEYHFASVIDFVLAAVRGSRERFDLKVATQLAPVTTPDAPRYTRVKYDMDDPTFSKGFAMFPAGKATDLLEYRLFAQPDRSADWMLFATFQPDAASTVPVATVPVPLAPIQTPSWDGSSRGTTFAVGKANAQGLRGPLSPPRYAPLAAAESLSLAVFPDAKSPTVVFSQVGPVGGGLVRSNLNSFHDDYGIRTNSYPGYAPWGGGLAFDAKKRMVMTDPHNHQVGWYEQAKLVQLTGGPGRNPESASSKPGFFNTPIDVAVDDLGRIYVADLKNNRVQELDDRGNFVRMFHEPDEKDDSEVFTHPKSLGFSFGKLCVTDLDGERIQIFDVTGKSPKRVRVLRDVREADRALVGKSGRVYVPAKDEQGHDAMLIYPIQPDLVRGVERPERTVPAVAQGALRGPRGFSPCKYPDGTEFGFYVTMFPFVVQRFMLE